MTTDLKIQEAIEAAVVEANQSQPLANKLVRWFEAIASGNENIRDTDSTDRHLELLYRETQTGAEPNDIETANEGLLHSSKEGSS